MKGSGVGGDSCLYRIFIAGGLVGVVGAVIATVLLTPDGSQLPLYVGFGAVAVFFTLLLLYWWIQLAFRGYGTPIIPPERPGAGVPDVSALQSWDSLFNAMVIRGGNPEEMKRYQRRSRRSLLIWFGMATMLVLCVLVSMGLYIARIIPPDSIRYIGLGIPALAIVMFVISLFLVRVTTEAGEHLFLAPLGLAIIQLPSVGVAPTADGMRTDVSGATVFGGTRFGRQVQVSLDIARNTTRVSAASPAFEIRSASGRLGAGDGAPEAVTGLLRGLRKAKRWQGVSVHAGPDGIRAERPGGGQNLWLYDLWLIERLFDAMDARR